MPTSPSRLFEIDDGMLMDPMVLSNSGDVQGRV